MIKIILIQLFISLVSLTSLSQIQLYIKPSISNQTIKGRLLDGYYSNPKYLTTPYFTFYNQGVTFDANLNFGISAGLILKNRHFIEFGVSGATAGVNFGFVLSPKQEEDNPDTVEKKYYPSVASGSFSSNYIKFSLDYSNQFFRTKNKVFASRVVLGIGLFFNRYVKGDNYSSEQHSVFLPINDPDKNIYFQDYHYEISDIQRVSPNITLGIGFDFFTKNDRNLFSIDVSYVHNFLYMIGSTHDISVLDNGVKRTYTIDIGSRGSGFVFQISRRFQLYPWIPLSKKKRLDI